MKNKKIINLFMFLLSIGLLVLLVNLSGESFSGLARKVFLRENYYFIIIVLAITIMIFWVFSERSRTILSLNTDVTKISKSYFFYNTSVSLFMSSLGSLASYMGSRVLLFKVEHNLSSLKTSYLILLEFFIGFICVLVLTIPAILYFFNIVTIITLILLKILLICMLIIGFRTYYSYMVKYIFFPVNWIFNKIILISFIKKRIKKNPFNRDIFNKIDKRKAFSLVVYSLIGYFLVLLRCLIYFHVVGIEIPLMKFIILYPLSYIIASLGITPGNLGVSDVAWYTLSVFLGVPSDLASVYVFTQRVFNELSYIGTVAFSYFLYLWFNRESEIN